MKFYTHAYNSYLLSYRNCAKGSVGIPNVSQINLRNVLYRIKR